MITPRHVGPSLLLLSGMLVGACAAPPLDEDGSSADAIARGASAARLSGRYAPTRSGSLGASLDLLVARETPEKALLQGRLLVQPQGTRASLDPYTIRDGVPFDATSCALTFSGILSKPETDQAVTVDVEVADGSGTSKGKLRFATVGAFGRFTGSQALTLTLERPSAACANALAPRGDLTKGLAWERSESLHDEEHVLEYRTLVRAVRPYQPPVGYASGIGHPAPPETAAAGEPVVVVRRSRGEVLIQVDRWVHGELSRRLTASASDDDFVPQPPEVKAMLRIAPP